MLNSLKKSLDGIVSLLCRQAKAWAVMTAACFLPTAAEFSLLAQSTSNFAPAEVAAPAVVSAKTNGRSHPSYTVLSNSLPEILSEGGFVSMGGKIKLSVEKLGALSKEDLHAAAELLEMSPGALDVFLSRVSAGEKTTPERLASDLRVWVLDYRYLHLQWAGYGPPKVSHEMQQKGLQLLESGHLDEVWALEAALPRPKAPTVRVAD
jgi:hypothetical protein